MPPAVRDGGGMACDAKQVRAAFAAVRSAENLGDVLRNFERLCALIDHGQPERFPALFNVLKRLVGVTYECRDFFDRLQKRAVALSYAAEGEDKLLAVRPGPCHDRKVLVVGAGPSGLRMAIEAQMMGAKVVVIEKRTSFSRKNIVYLWEYAVVDLRSLGAKFFYQEFCIAKLHTVGLFRLQLILLKIALLLGVNFYCDVTLESLVEPSKDCGFRANICPIGHPMSKYEFDVLIDASGVHTKVFDMDRPFGVQLSYKIREFIRLKLKPSIAVSANFENFGTRSEISCEQTPGVDSAHRQELTDKLVDEKGVVYGIENYLYYRSKETHYFLMTIPMNRLVQRGIVEVSDGGAQVLRPDKVNMKELEKLLINVARCATGGCMKKFQFSLNEKGQKDIAIFEYNPPEYARASCRILERNGKKLFTALVGDSLMKPFWPGGHGVVRGFLSAMDVCHVMHHWSSSTKDLDKELIQMKEQLYICLKDVIHPKSLQSITFASIDPQRRYTRISVVTLGNLKQLYDIGEPVKRESSKKEEACPGHRGTMPEKKTGSLPIGVVNGHAIAETKAMPVVPIGKVLPVCKQSAAHSKLPEVENKEQLPLSTDDRLQFGGVHNGVVKNVICTKDMDDGIRKAAVLPPDVRLLPKMERSSKEAVRPVFNPAINDSRDLVLSWYSQLLDHLDILIDDFTTSWHSGSALWGLICLCDSDCLTFENFTENDFVSNNQQAIDILALKFGIQPILTGEDIASCDETMEPLMLEYLTSVMKRVLQYYKENDTDFFMMMKGVNTKREELGDPDSVIVSEEEEVGKGKTMDSLSSVTPAVMFAMKWKNRVKRVRRSGSVPSMIMYFANRSVCPCCNEGLYQEYVLRESSRTVHMKCFRCARCFCSLLGTKYMFDAQKHKYYCSNHAVRLEKKEKGTVASALTKFEHVDGETVAAVAVTAAAAAAAVSAPEVRATGAPGKKAEQKRKKEPNTGMLSTSKVAMKSSKGIVSTVLKTLGRRVFASALKDGGDQELQKSTSCPQLNNTRTKDTCHYCRKHVYVTEKMSLCDRAFHRCCFKCESCSIRLNLKTFVFDKNAGRFLCVPHSRDISSECAKADVKVSPAVEEVADRPSVAPVVKSKGGANKRKLVSMAMKISTLFRVRVVDRIDEVPEDGAAAD